MHFFIIILLQKRNFFVCVMTVFRYATLLLNKFTSKESGCLLKMRIILFRKFDLFEINKIS